MVISPPLCASNVSFKAVITIFLSMASYKIKHVSNQKIKDSKFLKDSEWLPKWSLGKLHSLELKWITNQKTTLIWLTSHQWYNFYPSGLR